jgi:hypothetical protein
MQGGCKLLVKFINLLTPQQRPRGYPQAYYYSVLRIPRCFRVRHLVFPLQAQRLLLRWKFKFPDLASKRPREVTTSSKRFSIDKQYKAIKNRGGDP